MRGYVPSRWAEKSWYIFCDICGKRCLPHDTIKLEEYSGRQGLIVCLADADKMDEGLIPYKPRKARIPDFIRVNHLDTTNGTPVYDFDTDEPFIILSTSQGDYLSTSQGDLIIL